MGKSLLKIPVFATTIHKCQQVLKPHGIEVLHIITADDPGIFENILNCFVGIAACQVSSREYKLVVHPLEVRWSSRK
jgi:fatty acid synthase